MHKKRGLEFVWAHDRKVMSADNARHILRHKRCNSDVGRVFGILGHRDITSTPCEPLGLPIACDDLHEHRR
jgi:hypothetical protein